MIKFFRRIRQQFLSEKKFSKYVLYAIGEIVLVVIGILIALQINTWNEDAQNKDIERAYLTGILNNIDQDIYELDKLVDQDTLAIKHYTFILKAFSDKSINKYSKEFINALGKSYITQSFNGNSIVFEDMKSSGKINHIKSDVLRFSILEYYNLSQREIIRQNEMHIPEMHKLRDEAFHDNIDMNSLIEKFMFNEKKSAEINPLDLSFFDSDVNSDAVKKFANRMSLMKVQMQVNSFANADLVLKAQRLKNKITDYIYNGAIDIEGYIPSERLSAIKNGDIITLEKIIPKESINACFETKLSTRNYLEIAIREGAFESLKYFVGKGADIEQVCDNKTPLMLAVKYNELEMVAYLVDAGANIDFVSIKEKTALDYAIQYEHTEIAAYLKGLNAKQVLTIESE